MNDTLNGLNETAPQPVTAVDTILRITRCIAATGIATALALAAYLMVLGALYLTGIIGA